MNKKVDVAAVADLKERAFKTHGFPTYFEFRVRLLWQEYDKLENPHPYIWQLIPISLVTHLEAHFRACVENLIDAGEPYLSRAESLAKNMGFSFATIKALHGRTLTLGALIAHALPFSDYSHFEKPLTLLLDEPINELLKEAPKSWLSYLAEDSSTPIIEDFDATIRAMQKLFDARHIVTHEITNEPAFEQADLTSFYDAALALIQASNYSLTMRLIPDWNLTQADLNERAALELEEESQTLDHHLTQLGEIRGQPQADQLRDMIKSWEDFSEKFATLEADAYRGGSIAPMIYAKEKAALHRMFREHLEPIIEARPC